jgi:hypothetical protein
MTTAVHTPAVCEAREGRQDHAPTVIHPDGTDAETTDCLFCGKPVVRYWDSGTEEDGGRYGWSRWTLAAKAVVVV